MRNMYPIKNRCISMCTRRVTSSCSYDTPAVIFIVKSGKSIVADKAKKKEKKRRNYIYN